VEDTETEVIFETRHRMMTNKSKEATEEATKMSSMDPTRYRG